MTGAVGPLAFLAVSAVVLVELLRRLPLVQTVADLTENLRRGGRAMACRSSSDHWKQKILIARSLLAIRASLRLAGLVAIVALAALALIRLSKIPFPEISGFPTSPTGIAGLTAAAGLYAWIAHVLRRQ